MTRTEYASKFSWHLHSALKTSLFGPADAEKAIKAFLTEHQFYLECKSIPDMEKFQDEIDTLKEHASRQDIIYWFERSRIMAYLVARDNLNKFGVMNEHPTASRWVRMTWLNDVFGDYTKASVGNYAHRWLYHFNHQLGYILAAGAKMLVTGDARKVPQGAANYYIKQETNLAFHIQGDPIVYTVKSPETTTFKHLTNRRKDASNFTVWAIKTQLRKALQTMESVANVIVDKQISPHGQFVYTFKIKLVDAPELMTNKISAKPLECATVKKVAKVIQENQPAPVEQTETMNNVPNNVRPEFIALERAYSIALDQNKTLTEAYTKAKTLWEESTNRLDKLEQALELLK